MRICNRWSSKGGGLLSLPQEEVEEDVIRKYQGLIDLEEEKLRTRYEGE